MKTKHILLIIVASLMTMSLSNCTQDDGNYEYTTGINGIKFERFKSSLTFTVSERIEIIPGYILDDPTMKESDLSFSWKLNGKPYSNTKTLIAETLPAGDYTCELVIKDNRYGTMYPISTGFRVTAEFVDGWMILSENAGKSELSYLQLKDKNTPKDLVQDVYGKANEGQQLGSDPRKLVYHAYPAAGGTMRQLAVHQGGGQGSVELMGATMLKDINIKDEFLFPITAVPVEAFYRKYGNVVMLDDGNIYFKDNVIVNGKPVPHSTKYGAPIYAEGGIKAKYLLPMNIFSDNYVMPYANVQYCIVYDELNHRFLSVSSLNAATTGKINYMDKYNGDAILPGSSVNIAPDDALKWPGAENLEGYEVVATMSRGAKEGRGDESHVVSILKSKADLKYYIFQFGYWLTAKIEDVDLEIFEEFPGSEYINDKSIFSAFIAGEPYIYFSGGAGNNELYYYNVTSRACVKVHTANSRITAIKPGVIASWDFAEYEGYSIYVDRLLFGTEGGEVVLFNIDNGGNSIQVMKSWSGVGKVVDIEFMEGESFNVN